MYMPSNNFMDQGGGNNDSFAKACLLPKLLLRWAVWPVGFLSEQRSLRFFILWGLYGYAQWSAVGVCFRDMLATGCEDKLVRIYYLATVSDQPLKIFSGCTSSSVVKWLMKVSSQSFSKMFVVHVMYILLYIVEIKIM